MHGNLISINSLSRATDFFFICETEFLKTWNKQSKTSKPKKKVSLGRKKKNKLRDVFISSHALWDQFGYFEVLQDLYLYFKKKDYYKNKVEKNEVAIVQLKDMRLTSLSNE